MMVGRDRLGFEMRRAHTKWARRFGRVENSASVSVAAGARSSTIHVGGATLDVFESRG